MRVYDKDVTVTKIYLTKYTSMWNFTTDTIKEDQSPGW